MVTQWGCNPEFEIEIENQQKFHKKRKRNILMTLHIRAALKFQYTPPLSLVRQNAYD